VNRIESDRLGMGRVGEEFRHESERSNPDVRSAPPVRESDLRPRPQFSRYSAAVE
jgi:hypothetical protein